MSTPDDTAAVVATPEKRSGPLTRRRKIVVWTLVVAATLVLLISALTVFVRREMLNTDNFTASTTQLMRQPEVQAALATFLVDQIYQNVDVAAQLQKQLPKPLKGLAGPAAAALNDYGTRAATKLLGTNAVVNLVGQATRIAHAQFLRIVEGKPGAGDKVYLQLRPVVLKLASRLGLQDQVEAKLPPNAGEFLVLNNANGTINAVREGVKLLKALSLFLALLVVALYGAAIWVAKGWRRETILRSGFGVLFVGILLLVVRNVLQGVLLDALVGQRPARPAVSVTYLILTELLVDVAWTAVAVGLIAIVLAFLAGPGRIGRGFRSFAAPGLVRHPAIGWCVDALAIVLILVLAPIDDWNKLISRLVVFAVIIGLTDMIRRKAVEEHPDGGWTWDSVHWPWRGEPKPAASESDRVAQLERLTALHDRGAIDDTEFGRAKAELLGAS